MKKLLTIWLIALAMAVFSTPAMAWDPPYDTATDYGTNYTAGSNYEVGLYNGGLGTGQGDASATVYAPVGGSCVGPAGADANSSQAVASSAEGTISNNSWVSTEAYGEAAQFSSALFNYDYYNWASGGQSSNAYYSVSDSGLYNSSAQGTAETSGYTTVEAENYDSGNSNTGTASAYTASEGTVTAAGDCGFTSTFGTLGSGNVAHATYASQDLGEAWTNGTAAYGYDTNTDYGGHASTDGTSTVTYHNSGNISASALSNSYSSTGGSVFTGGGTYINSFPPPTTP